MSSKPKGTDSFLNSFPSTIRADIKCLATCTASSSTFVIITEVIEGNTNKTLDMGVSITIASDISRIFRKNLILNMAIHMTE